MVDNVRWKNITDLKQYIELAGTPDVSFSSLRTETEKLSHSDCMAEYMFLGLRLSEGISKEDFINEFGVSFDYQYGKTAEKLIDQGLLEEHEVEMEDELTGRPWTDTRIALTDRGVDVSNRVFAEFMP